MNEERLKNMAEMIKAGGGEVTPGSLFAAAVIGDMGAKIRDNVRLRGGKTLGQAKKSDYQPLTNIGAYVDQIIAEALGENGIFKQGEEADGQ